MDIMISILTLLLAGLPAYSIDRESPAEREERMAVVAWSIAAATEEQVMLGRWPSARREELAVMLVTLGWWESRFARHVHAGMCRAHECDHGLARSPWQVHAGGPVSAELWGQMADDSRESTLAGARGAARLVVAARGACGSAVDGVIGTYMTGRCEVPSQAVRRADDYMARLGQYRRLAARKTQ